MGAEVEREYRNGIALEWTRDSVLTARLTS
jgi:hypothetical protein